MLKAGHASSSKLRTWKLTGRCSRKFSIRTSAGTLSSLKSSSCLPSVPRGKCRNNISIRTRQLFSSERFKVISHELSYHSTLYNLNTESVWSIPPHNVQWTTVSGTGCSVTNVFTMFQILFWECKDDLKLLSWIFLRLLMKWFTRRDKT